MRITLPILCSTIALSACSYEETELQHFDFTGTVKIPVEALTLTIMDEDDNEKVIENDRPSCQFQNMNETEVSEGLPYFYQSQS